MGRAIDMEKDIDKLKTLYLSMSEKLENIEYLLSEILDGIDGDKEEEVENKKEETDSERDDADDDSSDKGE